MRHPLAGRVLGIVAMTAIAVPIAAPVASAKPASARANLVKAVTKADAQAKKLITRSRTCPAAASQRATTTKVRLAQTKGLRKASPTSLRLRQMRISVHTQRLAVALSRCSQAPGASAPGTPGARQLERSPGLLGGVQVASIPLDALGETLGASSVLDGAALPAAIPVVDLPSLAVAPTCVASGAVCVGVDEAGIGQALTGAVTQREQELPVLTGILDPLLAQVTSTLANDPASLLRVERTGDTTFVITAAAGTPLARLVALLGNSGALPSNPLGIVQVHP